MPTNISKKSNRINVKKLVCAFVTENTSTSYATSEVEDMGAVMSIVLTPEVKTGVLYGRGVKTEDVTKLSGMTVQIENNKVPIELLARLYGHKYADGKLIKNAEDEAPLIALGFEVTGTNKFREMCWLYCGVAQPFGNTYNQSEDNIKFSTDTFSISFRPREKDLDICIVGDTANADFTEEMAKTFLTTVPTA